jgi:hypothetical protein
MHDELSAALHANSALERGKGPVSAGCSLATMAFEGNRTQVDQVAMSRTPPLSFKPKGHDLLFSEMYKPTHIVDCGPVTLIHWKT